MTKEIILTKHQVALVDDEDYNFLSQYPWHFSRGYAINRSSFFHDDGRRKTVSMHRLIMNFKDSDVLVDHINGNGLDNRKSNLRRATRADNNRNMRFNSKNTSGYKGVRKAGGNWAAKISYNDKCLHIGTFTNKVDAAKAYNVKALELFGEFANLNDVDHSGFVIPERKPNTSIYKGVNKKGNRWVAGIYLNGKRIHIGSFETEIQAAMAFNFKSLELYGNNAKLNVINEEAI